MPDIKVPYPILCNTCSKEAKLKLCRQTNAVAEFTGLENYHTRSYSVAIPHWDQARTFIDLYCPTCQFTARQTGADMSFVQNRYVITLRSLVGGFRFSLTPEDRTKLLTSKSTEPPAMRRVASLQSEEEQYAEWVSHERRFDNRACSRRPVGFSFTDSEADTNDTSQTEKSEPQRILLRPKENSK